MLNASLITKSIHQRNTRNMGIICSKLAKNIKVPPSRILNSSKRLVEKPSLLKGESCTVFESSNLRFTLNEEMENYMTSYSPRTPLNIRWTDLADIRNISSSSSDSDSSIVELSQESSSDSDSSIVELSNPLQDVSIFRGEVCQAIPISIRPLPTMRDVTVEIRPIETETCISNLVEAVCRHKTLKPITLEQSEVIQLRNEIKDLKIGINQIVDDLASARYKTDQELVLALAEKDRQIAELISKNAIAEARDAVISEALSQKAHWGISLTQSLFIGVSSNVMTIPIANFIRSAECHQKIPEYITEFLPEFFKGMM